MRKPMKNKILFTLVTATICASSLAGMAQTQGYRFYISPNGSDTASGKSPDAALKTIEQARDAIRQLKKENKLNAPVTVFLRGGKYPIKEPLIFTEQDAGTKGHSITYQAYKKETPVLFGGRQITGWTQYKDNIWMAKIPAVKKGDWNFTQLFVNGKLRRRARIPNEGFFRVAGFPDGDPDLHYHTDSKRFEFKEGDIDPDWTNINDVEVIVYHFWTDSHLPIESIDRENNIVTFKHKAGKVFTDDFTDDGARYIVENVFEALDEPGEWYLNQKTGILYYIPRAGEDMNSVEVVAPVTPAFIHIKGKPVQRKLVKNLHFKGVSFFYTNWQLPPGNSNDRQGSSGVPAAITLKGAQNCSFENCTVKNIGTFAFEIFEGSTHNRFAHNNISYIAAGGFRINGGDEGDHPLKRTGHNEIVDNTLHHFGEIYPSAVGILIMHTNANRIAHNHIHHGWYTGISIGWEWGYQRSISWHNKVEYNHIHDIGQGLLSDMGAIYTLGVSPGTVIRNNLIHDVNANHYGGWGIYNDEGSTHLLIENNVVYNTKFAGYNIHFCKEVTVRNNIFAFGRLQQLSRSRVEPHQSVYFENNIVYWTEGELLDKNWNDKPFEFYFHPKNDSGRREVKSTFEMDWNIYYNPDKSADEVSFNDNTFEEWKKRGKDVHSKYVDPMFVDAANYDFRLKPDSPAFELGFQPIDMSNVGPR